ncbi:PIR Superfamily Protein, partial [Plasmodium malariae]
TTCQEIGRYLIEINNRYKYHSLKLCKYLHYKINSDENYNKNPNWLEGYKTFSSRTNDICNEEIKNIPLDNVFTASITTAAVLLTSLNLFILYRFTPVKTLLHSRLQRKKINEINKIEKEKTECLENILEEVNENCEGSFHNIGYPSQRDT